MCLIACWPWGAYRGGDGLAKGSRVKITSWRRIDQGYYITYGKGAGGYVECGSAKRGGRRKPPAP